MTRLSVLILLSAVTFARADEPKLPVAQPVGRLELVATFDGPMPTGVTVSRSGRIFVNFPRWGDKVDFTVAELKDGKAVAYPDAAINRPDKNRPGETLISVQSVVVDPDDRLWIVDTGSIEFGPALPGGPKLVGVDLKTGHVFKTISFPEDVALRTSYVNDVRFDLRRGTAGVAYLTDSSKDGPNGLIVVDLANGRSRRRLHDHPSTKADKNFLPLVEGRPLVNRPPGGKPTPMSFGSDGIAISQDGNHLIYCPLSSRRLYRVATDVLLNADATDAEVANAVESLGTRPFASDGLESDDQGRLYLTNYEDNAVMRRGPDGGYETLVYDGRALWPDTLSLAADGHLYFTANQLHRQKRFQEGKDLRQTPYSLFRIKVDGGPVTLRRDGP
ncbi:MAG: major royal jelly protein [Planctomycetota bacterium]|nr:major royal jelly protein [Planctomycetota bacterium]